MDYISALLLAMLALLFPPVSVALIAGCGADLLINIAFTLFGFVPGAIHAFYLLFVYYERRKLIQEGGLVATPVPGVYSDRIQRGGRGHKGVVSRD